MEKIIRIKATCPFFEIEENVSEKKAERRLKQIKKLFETAKLSKSRLSGQSNTKLRLMFSEGKLNVTTSVVNPSLI